MIEPTDIPGALLEAPPAFEAWAFIEIFGHNQIAGKLSEQTIAGENYMRVDVPAVDDVPAFTRYFSTKAIYSFEPCLEATCRRIASRLAVQPVGELPEFNDDGPGF